MKVIIQLEFVMTMIFVYLCLLCQEQTADAFHLHRYIPTHHYSHQLKPTIPRFATTTSLPSTASAAIPAKELEEFSEKRAQIPLRIAVAGAGIGGAILGAALQQKGFDVTVFEKAAKFSRFGGPIQLASNALSCVNALSPTLFEKIMNRFTFTGTRKCGIKDGVRNEWYAIFDAIPQIAEERSLPYTGVIDRPDLQEILLETMKPGTVKNSKSIDYYQQNKGNKNKTIIKYMSHSSYFSIYRWYSRYLLC